VGDEVVGDGVGRPVCGASEEANVTGALVGRRVGVMNGCTVGESDGLFVRETDGTAFGETEGMAIGATDGIAIGDAVFLSDTLMTIGFRDGALVGKANVGATVIGA
jgi:hypothetical protein